MTKSFSVVADFQPAGDQGSAIDTLAEGIEKGESRLLALFQNVLNNFNALLNGCYWVGCCI